MSTPPLGGIRPAFEVTCGAGDESNLCGRRASWHLIWDADVENSLSCDEHRTWAHERWTVYDEHPLTEVCTVPDAKLIWSWEEPPGRCLWVVSEETQALVLAAEEAADLVPEMANARTPGRSGRSLRQGRDVTKPVWKCRVCHEGSAMSENDVSRMCVWLVAHVDAVRMDEAAAEMVDEIEDVHRRLTRAVDNSPARTFWGRCDAVEDEGDEACGRDLYAKEKAEAIVCDGHRGDGVGCGAVKAVDDVRAKLREFTAGALVTIAEVHGAAHRLFPDRTEHELPSRRIMDGWTKGESPRIKSPQRNPANEPLFRGEELLRLVEGYKPHRSRRSRYAA